MKAYCVVTLPATLNVFEMVMPELIEASTVAEVPPNGITHEMPAAGAEVNGAVAKNPVPMQVEFAPASPMVRNTKMKRRYHGTAVMLIGIVTVCDVPSVVPPIAPYCGIKLTAPEAPVAKIPPAPRP